MCVCVCLHEWAALRSHASVHGERFGQHGRSMVDRRLADAAVERWQAGRKTRNCDAVWWTERGTTRYRELQLTDSLTEQDEEIIIKHLVYL